jgi:hypothetical protein
MSRGELARPRASVVAVAWPDPSRKVAPASPLAACGSMKVTVAPSIGLPAPSRTRARSGCANWPFTCALCAAGEAAMVARAAWLARVYVAAVETPETEAEAVKRPGVALATKGGEVASPEAFVCTLACAPPERKLALAPEAPVPSEKVTLTPCTGWPSTSRTCACKGCLYWLLTLAAWATWPEAAIELASPLAVFVR